jgi:hypothetical protein
MSSGEVVDRDSVQAAHGRMDSHEAVCAYRWASVEKQLVSMHARMDAISNRMWAAAGGLIGLCVVGIAGLLILYITKGR